MDLSNVAFSKKYGRWALVTGASSGIGAQFARSLAAKGLNIILTARRVNRLNELAEELSSKHAVQTHVIPGDLSQPGTAAKIAAAAANFEVGLLVNNAGVEGFGLYVGQPLEEVERLIAVNVSAVAVLANVVGRQMAARGRGFILFVSSFANRPTPYMALYAASKAFVSTLAVSLKYEMSEFGVDTMAFEPSFVESEILDRAKEVIHANLDVMATGDAVNSCLKVLGKQTVHTPGRMNAIWKFILAHFPTWMFLPRTAAFFRKALPANRTTLGS